MGRTVFPWLCKAGVYSAVLLWLASPFIALAADPSQFQHAGWSTADGAPSDIWAIEQAADGFLWLGTGESLYRFDGVRFERFLDRHNRPLPASDITALKLTQDGDIWVGYYQGGVSLIHDGEVTSFGPADGLPPGWVSSFTTDASGSVWASFAGGLAVFRNHRWSTIGSAMGFPGNHAGWVLVDPQGTLWVTGRDHIFFLRPGDARFTQTAARVNLNTNLARAPDGTLWVTDKIRGVRALPGLSVTHPDIEFPDPPHGEPFINGARLLFDHEGRLWGTDHTTGGVFLVDRPSSVAASSLLHEAQITARFRSESGLTSEQTSPLFEDKERNVWVGTNFGLDSFRHANVATLKNISANSGKLFSVAIDPAGTVWVASGKSLYQWLDGELRPKATFEHTIFELAAAPTNELWFHSNSDLYRWSNGVATAIGKPSSTADLDITSETPDRSGGLWAAFNMGGIFHWHDGRWTRWEEQPQVTGNAQAMVMTSQGVLWVGFPNNHVASFDGNQTHIFSAATGLNVGNVLSFSAEGADVIVGGETGIAWSKGDRFQSINSLGDLPIAGVSGIVKSGEMLWLNTSKGAVRIAQTELSKALDDGHYIPEFRIFDAHDGLPGVALQTEPTPSAMLDGQGNLWLETNKGVAIIDPSRIRTNRVAPPVTIRSVDTDKGMYSPEHALLLPRHTTRLRIAYTAASLSVPSQVHFRYKLDGLDRYWQEAGGRREAFYTNLGPGSYRFHVVAANEDGVWNDAGDTLDFAIAPAYYQTWWFAALCAVGAILAIGIFIKLRMHRYAEKLHIRLEERHNERDRIARDLHDTLLQSIHALVLSFEGVARQLQADSPARRLLDEALDKADEVIVEGRDRVYELRESSSDIGDIGDVIETAGSRLAQTYGFLFDLQIKGQEQELRGLVAEECFAIVREAMINAAKHSGAERVTVTLEFARALFYVTVLDNGSGIAPEHIDNPPAAHFGIRGMRERADGIGATLNITSAEREGTMVTLLIPSRSAYVRRTWVLGRVT